MYEALKEMCDSIEIKQNNNKKKTTKQLLEIDVYFFY